jgi:cation:H+ antiporter
MQLLSTLLFALVFIVISSELFCNAIEHLGEKIGVSEGVTGSIFAAVATALPETMIPILAIMGGHTNSQANNEIAAGAILGAPLMLSTLSMFLMAMSVIKKRGSNGIINIEISGLTRDIKFFLFVFALVIISVFTQSWYLHRISNFIIAATLALSYFMYILITIKKSSSLVEEGYGTTADKKLFITYLFSVNNYFTIFLQLVISLLMLIYFANMFINSVNGLATVYQLSPFLLSLIIIPIATELPEKINSILWIRKGRDTMALSNITGAMVFQASVLPIFGILFTPWQLLSPIYLIGMIITFISGMWVFINAKRGQIQVKHFFLNGVMYLLNIGFCLYLFKQ